MKREEITVEHVMNDDEFVYDNVQVRCFPKKGKIERMKCGLFDEDLNVKLRDFPGMFRNASAVGDGVIVTKGDDMTIIGGSRMSPDSFGKCASLKHSDGENQLLCKFWNVPEQPAAEGK